MTEFQKYIQRYLDLINDEQWKVQLISSMQESENLFSDREDEVANQSYEKGKWSIKELVQHLIDTERVFQYRLLAISRGDKNLLPGFDEGLYATSSKANERPFVDIMAELKCVRKSTILLVDSLPLSDLEREGNANGNPITALTVGKLIVGHHLHHLSVYKERYLPILG